MLTMKLYAELLICQDRPKRAWGHLIICSFAPNTKKLQKAAEADVSWTNSHFGLLIADDQSQWMKFINLSFVTGRLTGQRQCCLIVTTPNPRYSNKCHTSVWLIVTLVWKVQKYNKCRNVENSLKSSKSVEWASATGYITNEKINSLLQTITDCTVSTGWAI